MVIFPLKIVIFHILPEGNNHVPTFSDTLGPWRHLGLGTSLRCKVLTFLAVSSHFSKGTGAALSGNQGTQGTPNVV